MSQEPRIALPLRIPNDGSVGTIVDALDRAVVQVQQIDPEERLNNHLHRRERTAYILRAVNSHDELLASLKEMRDVCACALQALVESSDPESANAFHAKVKTAGIPNGAGVRADQAIRKAEQ